MKRKRRYYPVKEMANIVEIISTNNLHPGTIASESNVEIQTVKKFMSSNKNILYSTGIKIANAVKRITDNNSRQQEDPDFKIKNLYINGLNQELVKLDKDMLIAVITIVGELVSIQNRIKTCPR